MQLKLVGLPIFLGFPFLAVARPVLNHTTIRHSPEIHDENSNLLNEIKSVLTHRSKLTTIISLMLANDNEFQNNTTLEILNKIKGATRTPSSNSNNDVKLDVAGDKNVLDGTGIRTGGLKTNEYGPNNKSPDWHTTRSLDWFLQSWDHKDQGVWKPGGTHKEYKNGVVVQVPNVEHVDPNVVPLWYTKENGVNSKRDLVNVDGSEVRN